MSRTTRARIGTAAATAIFAMLAALLSVVSPTAAIADTQPFDPTVPTTVTADLLPTPQINGVVWSQVVVGNTVFVGGEFSTARPFGAAAGTQTVTRNNFLAYNLTTGALITTSWAHSFNAQVRDLAVSPDGTRLYAAGNFTTVNGSNRYRVAAFDVASGTLVSNWAPTVNSAVYGVDVSSSAVFISGGFSSVQGQARQRIASVSPAAGAAIQPFSATIPDNIVRSIQVSPDGNVVIIGGSFTAVNGGDNPGYGLARLNAASGASLPMQINGVVRNGGASAAVFQMSKDADSVYGAGYTFGGGGNFEGTFRANWAGDLIWVTGCRGDTYDIAALGDVVYSVGHPHDCSSIGGIPQTEPWSYQRAIAQPKNPVQTNMGGNFNGQPAPNLLNWFPSLIAGNYTGSTQAAWSVSTSGKYVLLGGEFPRVNNVAQQGLARFAMPDIAPRKSGPVYSGANYVPSAISFAAGTARLSWTANLDYDNERLTYALYRDGNLTTPVYTTTADSTGYWDRPVMKFLDSGLVPGSTHTYRLRTTDPDGNTALGDTISVTTATTGTLSDYAKGVLDDGAVNYWRLGESSGLAFDYAGGSDAVVGSGVTRGVAGAIDGDDNTAATFSGDANGLVATQSSIVGPQTFAVEAWIKTTSTSGGKIVGFGNSNTGTSSSYDRHLYMDGAGRIMFGVYPGDSRIVSTATGFNNGQWHHIVGNLSSAGQQLYVDGRLIGQRTDTTSAQGYNGYWRIGGDSAWSGDNWFDGTIDDVAVYGGPLTANSVRTHYSRSGHGTPLPTAPADAYGARVFADEPSLFWRLAETSGTTAVDAGPNGARTGVYSGNVVKGAAGALRGVSNTAGDFRGGDSLVSSSDVFSNPQVYSLELWFNTTTNRGGKLMGFGRSQTGGSGSYDRHIYMEDDGRVSFGTWTGQMNIITSAASFNNGAWHHVVATQSSAGLRLYIDGALVGTNPATQAEGYDGYWRVGGDNGWGGSDQYIVAKIDEVAVYDSALDASTVAAHRALGLSNAAPTAAFTVAGTDLTRSFDATGSSDPDGSITGYSWNWGDGTATGSGATATHIFAASGTYPVTLTVTDDGGLTATSTQSVTVVGPNALPTAAFTASATLLTASVDGSGSVDPDGSISSYMWNWGDGSPAGSGATATHTYAAAGDYTITLSVTDDRGGSNSATQQVTAVAPPANQAPTASFTTGGSGRTVTVDGGTSSDPDGTIAGYSWNWGDGTAATTGATSSHAYAADGTYTVTLTVTDNGGLTATTTRSVTVTGPVTPSGIATDDFGRTVANGLGTADLGGAWTTVGTATSYSVTGGVAKLRGATAGGSLTGYLGSVSSTDVDLTATVSLEQAPTGSGVFASLIGRRVGSSDYRARLGFLASGLVNIELYRGSTYLTGARVAGLSSAAGEKINLRVQVFGSGTTTIQARAWKTGTTEPTTWQLSRTDTTAALQTAGSVGIGLNLGGTVTTLPTVATFDGLRAVSTAGPGEPPANVPPVAAIASTVSGLTANLSGTGSSDADGTIVGYAWTFGDGTTGTGATVSHPYAAAGTYPVTLTVTDNRGATATASGSVTVADAPANTPPSAAFTSTSAGLTASVDGSGSTDAQGAIASYSWNWGDGTAAGSGATASHAYAASGTYQVTLTVTDGGGLTNAITKPVTVTAPVVPPGALAADTFERAVASGLGTADVGGAWTTSGANTTYAVADGTAQFTSTAAGAQGTALLSAVSSASTDVVATVALSQVPTGGSTFVSVIGRRVGTNDYRARIAFLTSGLINVELYRGSTWLQSVRVAGITYAAGEKLSIRVQVTGANPTTIRSRVWRAGTTEPTTWQASITDTTAALQTAGSVGIASSPASAATGLPLVTRFDDLSVVTVP